MVTIPTAIRMMGCTALLLSASLSVSTASAQNAALSPEVYAQLLQQIADKKLDIAQRQLFIEKQKEEIAFLRSQIEAVGPTTEGVDVMVNKIAAATEDAINSDFPFMREERLARIDRLKSDIASPEMKIGGHYRQALNALKIEVNYGFSVESYPGERPLNDGENQNMVSELDAEGVELIDAETNAPIIGPELGDYLRYGRLALVFLNQRATEARRYDLPTKTWVDMSAAELNDVRRAVRISKGQSAPAVITAPVYKAE